MTWGLSHQKKGVVRIFVALKNPSPLPGLNPRPLGPVASTLTTTPPRRRETYYSPPTTAEIKKAMRLVSTPLSPHYAVFRLWDNVHTVTY
jgi:hypothetical protein